MLYDQIGPMVSDKSSTTTNVLLLSSFGDAEVHTLFDYPLAIVIVRMNCKEVKFLRNWKASVFRNIKRKIFHL